MIEDMVDKSYRVNGWAIRYSNAESRNLSAFDIDTKRIKPICITSVSEYLKELLSFSQKPENPLLYRGQVNANYLNLPSVMRSFSSIKKENILFKEFQNRFYKEVTEQPNTFSKLSMMQHYGLKTRLLDVTEDPLAALFFACKPYVKFNSGHDDSWQDWGTITLFQAPEGDDGVRYNDSNTVKVISNTALCQETFEYGKLELFAQNDKIDSVADSFILFKDIISRSIIVRPQYNTSRIKNQRGCFILCNCNKVVSLPSDCHKSPKEFMEDVISNRGPENLYKILEQKMLEYGHTPTKWDFYFEKCEPYSLDNPIEQFKSDPFDLKKLFYKTEDKKQVVFFIPPACKKSIIEELRKLNITDSFIYPEMDTTANELNYLYGEDFVDRV